MMHQPNIIQCPKCGSIDISEIPKVAFAFQRFRYYCNTCYYSFNVEDDSNFWL